MNIIVFISFYITFIRHRACRGGRLMRVMGLTFPILSWSAPLPGSASLGATPWESLPGKASLGEMPSEISPWKGSFRAGPPRSQAYLESLA